MEKNRFSICIKVILLCFCVSFLFGQEAFAMKKRKPVEVEIKSFDGFKLVGELNIPNYASIETKAPLVIFLHSICKSHLAWEDFPQEVKDSLNVATLNMDLRGHGKSIIDKDGKDVSWQTMVLADYKKMPDDILEVLKYIEKEYPEIDSKKVAIVGAGLGATMGLMAASYKENIINTVIIFSPMLEYKGFDLRLPIVKYGKHPIFFIVSKKDKYSYNSALELFKFLQGKKKMQAYPYGGNAEDLLKFQPDSAKLVVEWLKENFTNGSIAVKINKIEQEKERKFKYRKVGKYFGKIKKDGDIYGSIH